MKVFKRSRPVFIGLAIAVFFFSTMVGVYGLITVAPVVIVDKMLERDIKSQAQLWETRVIKRLTAGKSVFENRWLTEVDKGFLKNITLSSDIYRFSLFNRDGLVFWSSNESEIGRRVSGAFFADIIAKGENYYTHMAVRPSEVDDFELHAVAREEGGLREVAEIFTPVIRDGRVLGAIEFFTDITDIRNTFILRVRIGLTVICAIVLGLVTAIILVIRRANRAAVRRINAQTAKERDLLEGQLQMAREVRLLGELNEWLQSSRSLDELFDMVSRFMTHILPFCEGSVYVYSNSRDVLDGWASWNGGCHRAHIHPEACWGLRRGRPYSTGESEVDFPCAHEENPDGRPSVCFPILAHGETVGLMTLRAKSETDAEAFQDGRRLAQMCAEQISMAIANVQMRDQLHDQSVRDPLTGLFNRRHLTDALRRMITRSQKDGVALSLVSIDVDHFKKFNDNHGHDAGDMVLRAVGGAMTQLCDGDELACRLGGEEFMLLLPEMDKAAVLARAERLRQNVEALSVRYGDKHLPRITISIGIAHYPDHGTLPQDLMRSADDALYEAKDRGRNQTVVAHIAVEKSGGDLPPPMAAE